MLDQPVHALIPIGRVDHISSDTLALDAVRYMAQVRRGAVPVISDGRLVGMFSERDLMLRVVLAGRNPATTRVEEVMSKELVVANATDLCRDCLAKMKQMHFRHMPVVEEGKLVGILSLRDLMEAEAQGQARDIDMLNYYVGYAP
jgi:CBS domain-containing protein